MNNRPLSITETMAAKYGMEADKFMRVLRDTVLPKNCAPEQEAAFLLVAKHYDLNPVTREIYAYPKPGGGIQAIVGVDGWVKLINSHPQMDGIEFEDIYANGDLIAIKCRIYRKDRNRPTEVGEYMAECKRPTEPWRQWPIRMLRHKALSQCARVAFGFAGIMDVDEYERWAASAAEATPQSTKITRTTKKAMAEEFRQAPGSGGYGAGGYGPTSGTSDFAPAGPSPEAALPKANIFAVGDAFEMGHKAWHANASRLQWPGGWKDKALINAWEGGWDAARDEAVQREAALVEEVNTAETVEWKDEEPVT
jgi:RecT family.